jgi:hypothetical protein
MKDVWFQRAVLAIFTLANTLNFLDKMILPVSRSPQAGCSSPQAVAAYAKCRALTDTSLLSWKSKSAPQSAWIPPWEDYRVSSVRLLLTLVVLAARSINRWCNLRRRRIYGWVHDRGSNPWLDGCVLVSTVAAHWV